VYQPSRFLNSAWPTTSLSSQTQLNNLFSSCWQSKKEFIGVGLQLNSKTAGKYSMAKEDPWLEHMNNVELSGPPTGDIQDTS
jgi:hypothetical protein